MLSEGAIGMIATYSVTLVVVTVFTVAAIINKDSLDCDTPPMLRTAWMWLFPPTIIPILIWKRHVIKLEDDERLDDWIKRRVK